MRDLLKVLTGGEAPDRHHPRASSAFHLDSAAFFLSDYQRDQLTWRELCEGVACIGSAGSGKSSIVAKALFRLAIRPVAGGGAGTGVLAPCARPGDADDYERWAIEEGRGDDVVRVTTGGEWTMALLANEVGQTDPLMQPQLAQTFLTQVGELIGTQKSGDTDFFMTYALSMIEKAATVLMLAGFPLTLSSLNRVVKTALEARDEVDEQFRRITQKEALEPSPFTPRGAGLALYTAIRRGNEGELSAGERGDLERVEHFYLNEYPQLADRTRSSVLASYANLTDGLLSGLTRQLFFSDAPTLTPEWAIANQKIVILDFPVKQYGDPARYAQMLTIWSWARALERRYIAPDDTSTPPYLFMLDEFQLYMVPKFYTEFFSTVRGARGMVVCLSQSFSAVLSSLEASRATFQANAILGNLQLKIALSTSDHATAQWFADSIGLVNKSKDSGSYNFSTQQGSGINVGGSTFQHLEHAVLPVTFSLLKKADWTHSAGAMLWRTGRIWEATGKHYLTLNLRLNDLLGGN